MIKVIVKTRLQLVPITSNMADCDVIVGKRFERPQSATVGKRRTTNTPLPSGDVDETLSTSSQLHSIDGDSEMERSIGRRSFRSRENIPARKLPPPSPDRDRDDTSTNSGSRMTGKGAAFLSVPVASTAEGYIANKRRAGRSSPLYFRQQQNTDSSSFAVKTASRPTSPAGYAIVTSRRLSPANDGIINSSLALTSATAEAGSKCKSRGSSPRGRSPPSAPCNSPQPPVMMLPLYDELSLPIPFPDALPSGSGLLVACDLYLASGRKVADKYRARSLLDVSPTGTIGTVTPTSRDIGSTPTSLKELYNAPLTLDSSIALDRKPARKLQPIERNF